MHKHRTLRRLSALALAMQLALPAQAAAEAPRHSYDMPAQPLGQALAALAAKTGLLVASDARLVSGKQAPALHGNYTTEAALARLLEHSDLIAVPNGAGISLKKAPATQAGGAAAAQLPEVMVYGDRTTSSADVSNSSLAIADARALGNPATGTWRDAFRLMANVSTGNINNDGFIIRGVNSEGFTPGQGAPLAAIYMDGVQQTYEGARRGVRGNFDMTQMEVYRGPQSTLSGRNAMAGAIYLRSKDPEFRQSGHLQLTGGEDDHRQIGLAYGNAISEQLAFRVSGEWSEKDSDLNYPSYQGYKRYKDFSSDEYHTVRGKLLWLPAGSDDTQVLLSYARAYDRPTSNYIAGPGWQAGTTYKNRRGDIYGGLTPAATLGDINTLVGGYNMAGGMLPSLPFPQQTLAFQAGAPFYEDVRETTVDNAGLEVTHALSDTLTLTAQTGWTRSLSKRRSINEGTAGEQITQDGEFDQSIATQEIRLNHDSGALRWVAGLYTAREDREAFRNLRPVEKTRNDIRINNIAAFGELSREFTPGWRVIAGGRLDSVRQKQNAFSHSAINDLTALLGGGMPLGAQTTRAKNSDTTLLPKVGLEHQLAANQRISLIYQEGYRPGGADVDLNGTPYEYDAETAHNVELSWQGRFADNRLRLAASLFHQDWKKQQVEISSTTTSNRYIANAGRSTSYGAELEAAYAATPMLQLHSAVGLLHTRFKDFKVSNDDYSGRPFPAAPRVNVAAGFRYGLETGWLATGNIAYNGRRMSSLEAGTNRPAMLDDYTTVDASIGYGWHGGLRLTAYASNLFDEEYLTYESTASLANPGTIEPTLAVLGARREAGLRLDYRF